MLFSELLIEMTSQNSLLSDKQIENAEKVIASIGENTSTGGRRKHRSRKQRKQRKHKRTRRAHRTRR